MDVTSYSALLAPQSVSLWGLLPSKTCLKNLIIGGSVLEKSGNAHYFVVILDSIS